MICTPAYGGNFNSNYVHSLVNTLHKFGSSITTCFLSNESLIQRGRNKCARLFLESKCDKLLFIDSDIGWEPENVETLLSREAALVGATYPMKTLPIQLNYNVLDGYFNNDKSFEGFKKLQKTPTAKSHGVVEALHIPTGFMMIDRLAFDMLKPHVPTYTDNMGSESVTTHDFFQVQINKEFGIQESEDWFFCSLARKHDIGVYLETSFIVTHTGTYTFEAK